jgi:hypothetical protein
MQGAIADDCMEAGARTTHGAVVEEQISALAVERTLRLYAAALC